VAGCRDFKKKRGNQLRRSLSTPQGERGAEPDAARRTRGDLSITVGGGLLSGVCKTGEVPSFMDRTALTEGKALE